MNLKTKFPIFDHHPELVYLDSGATTHKPKVVIDAMTRFLNEGYGTVHRGIYDLSVHATNAYNESREKVKGLLMPKHLKTLFLHVEQQIALMNCTWLCESHIKSR